MTRPPGRGDAGPFDPHDQPLDVETVFEGNLLSVEVQTWPGDTKREVAHHPGAAGVVALVGAGELLMVRQPRQSVRSELLEIPAGVYDVEGESPEEAARREVLEETGHRVVRIRQLGTIYSSPGFSDERIDLFLARVEPHPSQDPAEEGVRPERVPLDEAMAAVAAGDIRDAKTICGLFLAREAIVAGGGV